MVTLLTLILVSYLLLLLILIFGWIKIRLAKPRDVLEYNFISIVIPFRNEAKNLDKLLASLVGLNYPIDKFEVVFVDDHSTDDSLQLIQSPMHFRSNYHAIALPIQSTGKKRALTAGIMAASGNTIATTDADCKVPVDWLLRINEAFQTEHLKVTFGAVKLNDENSLFSSLQSIEFASLIGTSAASIGLGKFIMCNGANLAFKKSTFIEINGYEGNLNIPSGDDEFLVRKILKKHPESLGYIASRDSVVETSPLPTFKDFIHQRLRWAGKWKYNDSWSAKLMAVWILFVQISFGGLFLMLITSGEAGMTWLVIALKIFLEGVFLYSVIKFLDSRWSWLSFLLLQFIYPFYVIGIGIMSQYMFYDWKGRRLSPKM
jgi:cellulose synthase/poly-beta-1,6-N-acetylglucosamine synthase-like glycosyltransferase